MLHRAYEKKKTKGSTELEKVGGGKKLHRAYEYVRDVKQEIKKTKNTPQSFPKKNIVKKNPKENKRKKNSSKSLKNSVRQDTIQKHHRKNLK